MRSAKATRPEAGDNSMPKESGAKRKLTRATKADASPTTYDLALDQSCDRHQVQ